MRVELATLRREVAAKAPQHATAASKAEGAVAKDALAEVFRDIKVATRASEKAAADMRQVRGDLEQLRQSVNDQLLQHTMIVTRAARALEAAPDRTDGVRLSGRTVPLKVEPSESGAPVWKFVG